MTIVRDIQELFDLNDAWDAEADALVTATLADHPSVDLSPRPFKLISPNDSGNCQDCGEAQFLIRDQRSGRTTPICRACINAVRRQSLHHRQYSRLEICWNCKITTDSLGIIDGAIHHMFPLEDQTLADGTIRRGIGDSLRAGRIDLTNNVLTILP